MSEDKKLDLGQISDLLDIVERTFQRPRLKALHDAALAELEQISADLVEPKPAEQEAADA